MNTCNVSLARRTQDRHDKLEEVYTCQNIVLFAVPANDLRRRRFARGLPCANCQGASLELRLMIKLSYLPRTVLFFYYYGGRQSAAFLNPLEKKREGKSNNELSLLFGGPLGCDLGLGRHEVLFGLVCFGQRRPKNIENLDTRGYQS